MKALVTTALLALSAVPAVAAETKDMKIALSNNFAGNSWRQAMLKSWETVTKKAVADGVVAEAPAFTTSENQATEQAAQIQNMILQGYNAIVIDAASPTALNGAIKQACDAGIVVVTFDGIATEPCAYRIAVDFKKLGGMQVDYFKGRGIKGNVLEVRGLAGVFVDDEIHDGIVAGVKATPTSRSSAASTATGPRPWRRRKSPASCRPSPMSWRWPPRAATASAPPRRSRTRAARRR